MKRFIFILAAALLSGCVSAGINENGVQIDPVGKTYYTKVNIWYERPSKILSANFHKGAMIPAGTKVKITSFGSNRVSFQDDFGVTFTLINVKRYSDINLESLFKKHFSVSDVTRELGRFNKIEQENIMKGTIAEGMSKEAVLMSYGYPPAHRTPSLSADIWTYWKEKYRSFTIEFRDNRVIRTSRSMQNK